MNPLRIVLFRNIPEDAKLRTEWNALARSVEHPQVFYTYEWALAVHRAYEATLPAMLFLAYDEQERLRGVVALAVNEKSGRISFLCPTTGDYCDFLSSKEDRPGFVWAVLAELRKLGFDRVTLTNLPADSVTVAALRGASVESGYHFFARTAYECAQVAFDALPRREGKMVQPRARKWRRAMNTIGRDVPIRVEHVQSFEDAAPILPQFAQMHIGRFLATGRISNLARAERRHFLEELARLLGESGWLRLSVMVKGERIVAWNYGFQFEDTWFWYQPTFETELEKYSPGFCLLGKIIEDAAATSQIKVVDLGLGAEEYKEALANQTRETVYVT
ncbi:MAG: GNAT family N-acetyltransferase, partial [Candidatus Sulfotelmatobacter sp.]